LPVKSQVITVFQLQIQFGCSAVVYCACELILLLSVIYLLRAVYKFDFALVINRKPGEW